METSPKSEILEGALYTMSIFWAFRSGGKHFFTNSFFWGCKQWDSNTAAIKKIDGLSPRL